MVAFEEVAKYVTPELAYTVWLERRRPWSAAGGT